MDSEDAVILDGTAVSVHPDVPGLALNSTSLLLAERTISKGYTLLPGGSNTQAPSTSPGLTVTGSVKLRSKHSSSLSYSLLKRAPSVSLTERRRRLSSKSNSLSTCDCVL